jgi:hypothetical protein
MGDPKERYLAALSSLLDGSSRDRRRLHEELAAHLDDARERGFGEAEALECLGRPEEVAAAWNERCARRRTQQRIRAASVAAVAGAACLLGVVQYAKGAPAGHRSHAPAVTKPSFRPSAVPFRPWRFVRQPAMTPRR